MAPKPILNSNRHFEGKEDVLYTCLLQKVLNTLPEKQHQLILKGRRDNSTIATISVTIRYTKEFAETMGVHPQDGMYLVAAKTLAVSPRFNSD